MPPTSRDVEARFRLFADRVDRAVSRRAVKDRTVHAQFSMRADRESTSMTFDTGDEDDLRSLILDFRPFLLRKEDVFCERIFNDLERFLIDAEMRDAARASRADWRRALAGHARLIVDGKEYGAEDCFDLVVNSDLFHLDSTKASEYEALPEFLQKMVFGQMTSLVISGIKVLHITRNIVNRSLDEGLLDLSGSH